MESLPTSSEINSLLGVALTAQPHRLLPQSRPMGCNTTGTQHHPEFIPTYCTAIRLTHHQSGIHRRRPIQNHPPLETQHGLLRDSNLQS